MLKQKSYSQQFSHIYVSRLQLLRDAVARQVEAQSGAADVLPKIIDLREGGAACVVIGTLLKALGGKPDVFAALTSERGLVPIEQTAAPLATEDDQLVLEDESGRVELVGDISIGQLVTGVVLGVQGSMDAATGAFRVSRVFLPSLPPQPPLPARSDSEYVALVSGLSMGTDGGSTPLRNHVLVDYLAGRIGDEAERQFVSRIVRTIVVGNSVAGQQVESSLMEGSSKKKQAAEQLEAQAVPLKEADELLSTLASSMAVDLMPGASDPSNYALPQQSFHPCLFPRSARFSSFRSVTNPYEAQIGGVGFFGHSGQPLASVLQCSLPERRRGSEDVDMATDDETAGEDEAGEDEAERALDALQRCLEWRHAAPTAPDLLACFPVARDDPFILETCPHVLFAGNQKHFATRVVDASNSAGAAGKGQSVRVVTVPSFAETATVVLVDLKDLSCFPVTIA